LNLRVVPDTSFSYSLDARILFSESAPPKFKLGYIRIMKKVYEKGLTDWVRQLSWSYIEFSFHICTTWSNDDTLTLYGGRLIL